MAKFTKGDSVKHVDENSACIDALLADGWEQEGLLRTVKEPQMAEAVSQAPKAPDLSALRQEAEALGLKYSKRSGVEKLVAMIKDAKAKWEQR